MLKKIPSADLRPGMFVQSFDSSWFNHPFWRTKFLVEDQATVAGILDSGVKHLWIDESKSRVIGGALPAQPAAAPPPPASPAPRAVETRKPAREQRVELEVDVQKAAQLVGRMRGEVTTLFTEVRMGKAMEVDQVLPFVEEVSASVQRNSVALVSLARLKTKDDYTFMHSVSVCALMVALARQIGLSEEETRQAGVAGMLHDIGKMAIPLDILNKPGSLTDQEFSVVRKHPEQGFAMLSECKGLGEIPLDVCLHHHEKIDGSGYPKGLSGEQITRMARMGAICDVYDAITSTRAYKQAWDPSASIQRMSQWKGSFDPDLFQSFVRCIGIYPVGTLVKLESGKMGVVVDQNPRSLIKPRVKVFYSTTTGMPVHRYVLDLASPDCPDRIVSRELPEKWGFENLQDLWMGTA
jgi:putative nucleotidyltransferase with HDIG domain